MTYYVENIMLMASEDLVPAGPWEFKELDGILKSKGYIPVKTALRRGNVKRSTNTLINPCLLCIYSGKYGDGFSIHVNDKEYYGYHKVIYYTKGE